MGVSGCGCSSVGAAVRVGCGVKMQQPAVGEVGDKQRGLGVSGCGCSSVGAAVRVGCGVKMQQPAVGEVGDKQRG